MHLPHLVGDDDSAKFATQPKTASSESLGRHGKKMRAMSREDLPTTLRDNDNIEVGRNDWGEIFRD